SAPLRLFCGLLCEADEGDLLWLHAGCEMLLHDRQQSRCFSCPQLRGAKQFNCLAPNLLSELFHAAHSKARARKERICSELLSNDRRAYLCLGSTTFKTASPLP